MKERVEEALDKKTTRPNQRPVLVRYGLLVGDTLWARRNCWNGSQ